MSLYKKSLDHLVWMASMEGAKAEACYSALKLDSDETGMWQGIAADLMARVPGLEKVMASVAQRLMKRP